MSACSAYVRLWSSVYLATKAERGVLVTDGLLLYLDLSTAACTESHPAGDELILTQTIIVRVSMGTERMLNPQ